MTKLADHPSVVRFRESERRQSPTTLDASWLKQLALDAGADDVGFVAIDRPELDDQRAEILGLYPWAKTLHQHRLPDEPGAGPQPGPLGRQPRVSSRRGRRERGRPPDRRRPGGAGGQGRQSRRWGSRWRWIGFPARSGSSAHKPVAVAAGLGRMGIHRNVIHPKFGNFILLGTILIDAEVSEQTGPIDYNPCLECKLCVAACPVGAIAPDGHFDFSACLTHNYREFLGGFVDWVEQVADSRNARDYRRRVTDSETASMWQSLGFGPNYKAAYCMAVCPAGDDVIGPFLTDRKGFLNEVVDRCRTRRSRCTSSPARTPRRMSPSDSRTSGPGRSAAAGGRDRSGRSSRGLPHVFQRHASEGLDAATTSRSPARKPPRRRS